MSQSARPLRAASLVSTRDERGFTLIELIIVTAIMPLIIGAIAVGLVQIFSLQGSISNRLQNSNDTQVVNSALSKDVQVATSVTTMPNSTAPAPCGTGTFTQLLGLQLNSGAEVVTYATESNGTSTTVNLVRNLCVVDPTSPSNSPTYSMSSSNVLAFNVSPSQVPPVVTCLAAYSTCTSSTASSGWLGSSEVQEVTFTVSELTVKTLTPYQFTLSAYPSQNISTDPATLGGPTALSKCGFALAGTGTYAAGAARQLCFMDFGLLNTASNMTQAETATGLDVKELVANTGYTLSFNLQISLNSNPQKQLVEGATFPTYPKAFLGNNGPPTNQPFYSGVGCSPGAPTTTTTDPNGTVVATPSCIAPAIYEKYNSSWTGNTTFGGQVTVTISNIQVMTPGNSPAQGYELVTMDAETTDASEWITWTITAPDLAGALPYHFQLIPNVPGSTDPISLMGNACDQLSGLTGFTIPAQLTPGQLIQSTNNTVKCASSVSSTKTGTPMLGFYPIASNPPTLTTTMYGTGLEGIGFALMLAS